MRVRRNQHGHFKASHISSPLQKYLRLAAYYRKIIDNSPGETQSSKVFPALDNFKDSTSRELTEQAIGKVHTKEFESWQKLHGLGTDSTNSL